MEERRKKINEIIAKIATQNPNITEKQLIRAKTMYSDDLRPLEEIEQELLAYSLYVSSNSKRIDPTKKSVVLHKDENEVEELSLEKTMPLPTVISTVEAQTPKEEMAIMFEEYDNKMKNKIASPNEKAHQRQLVKTQANEKGYGNVSGLLTIATILAIMTIVISIFTIITN